MSRRAATEYAEGGALDKESRLDSSWIARGLTPQTDVDGSDIRHLEDSERIGSWEKHIDENARRRYARCERMVNWDVIERKPAGFRECDLINMGVMAFKNEEPFSVWICSVCGRGGTHRYRSQPLSDLFDKESCTGVPANPGPNRKNNIAAANKRKAEDEAEDDDEPTRPLYD